MKRNLLTGIFVLMICFTSSCIDISIDGSDNDDKDGYSHLRNPGFSANDFLSDESYSELIIEIDYMRGYPPNNQALNRLKDFLENRLHKTSIVILEPTEIPGGNKNIYTANEIRNLENRYRGNFTEGETLTAYMIIVDARYEQTNVLGIAYQNTSAAFFGVTYEDATSGFGAPSRYLTEAISFQHEFGHLLGLVGISNSGTEMQTEHKDEEHGNHCDNESCLMYYAMENAGLLEQFLGEEIPQLDAYCIADLRANGGKKN